MKSDKATEERRQKNQALEKALEAVDEANDDIDIEKIQVMKYLIKEGKYKITGEQIADSFSTEMLKDLFDDK